MFGGLIRVSIGLSLCFRQHEADKIPSEPLTFSYTIGSLDQERSMPVLWKSASVWILLFGMVTLSGSARAGGGFLDMFDEGESSAAAKDRAFEGKVYDLLEQQAGVASRYVQVTRFGNIIVITGEVKESAHATVIDGLVLEAAGIKRETQAGSTVVPKKKRECGGRAATGNTKRRMIVTGKKDCSSLRSDEPEQAKGKVYNHLSVAAPDMAMKVAAANLLLAEAVSELVDAGYTLVLDRAAMRTASQDGVLYILGNLGEVQRTRIKAVLMSLPDVRDVTFYTE
jgi:hypothetical protein